MRLAVLIIGLGLALLIFFQGCTTGIGAEDESGQASAAAGLVIVAFGYLVGAAFVMGWPLVASIVYGITAAAAFLTATGEETTDLPEWGGLALVLAGMSLLGWRGKRRDDSRKMADRRAELDRAVAAGIAAAGGARSGPAPAPEPAQTITCPNCGATDLSTSIKFCPNCGLQRTEPPTP